LICISCIKELSRALKFRHRCRETDEFLKKTIVEVESLLVKELQNDENEANESSVNEQQTVKEESQPEPVIKDEPADEFNLELFEHIDTILEENLEGSAESNALDGILKRAKREDSYSDISDDDSEYEEMRRKRKLRNLRRASEFEDSEMM
jgi:hypothetical protein